ncbi:unnamed protein product, partial [Symbiodinium pilosum]
MVVISFKYPRATGGSNALSEAVPLPWDPDHMVRQVLDVYKALLICRLDPEWRGDDGGVYVGRGDVHTTCSVFCESYRDTLDRQG